MFCQLSVSLLIFFLQFLLFSSTVLTSPVYSMWGPGSTERADDKSHSSAHDTLINMFEKCMKENGSVFG